MRHAPLMTGEGISEFESFCYCSKSKNSFPKGGSPIPLLSYLKSWSSVFCFVFVRGCLSIISDLLYGDVYVCVLWTLAARRLASAYVECLRKGVVNERLGEKLQRAVRRESSKSFNQELNWLNCPVVYL
jgi:hypothetical protein